MIFAHATIAERKNRAARGLSQVLKDDDVVLVSCGGPIQRPGGHDQTYPFLPHPDYFWITGSRRPHGVSAFSKAHGWIDFVLPVSRDEKIWEGGAEVIPGRDVRTLEAWLSANKFSRTFRLGQYSQGSTSVSEEERRLVQEAYNVVRRVKDEEEIALVKRLASIAARGYAQVKNTIREGLTERDIQLAYESEVLTAGAEKLPYDSIVGAGSNSAVLHAIPTMRILKDGEHILIDAGADIEDYCVDITRVFPVNGKIDERLKLITGIVKKAQDTSMAMLTPGTEWRDVHLASAKVMAQGLCDLGILRISAEEALETKAIGVFFPHGVGHMVGLRVRDVGGPDNPNPKWYAGARLRVDMPLRSGHLMTVEPGLYFIEALLEDEETRRLYKDQINWTEALKWKDFGGVRLEDDILVTEQGPINLTAAVPHLL